MVLPRKQQVVSVGAKEFLASLWAIEGYINLGGPNKNIIKLQRQDPTNDVDRLHLGEKVKFDCIAIFRAQERRLVFEIEQHRQ
jgi:hypothetical protein